MKNYIFTLCLSLLVFGTHAADQGEEYKDAPKAFPALVQGASSAPSKAARSAELTPPPSVEALMSELSDPQNREQKGGVLGGLVGSVNVVKEDAIRARLELFEQHNADLRGQLVYVAAIQRSLGEAQQKYDEEKRLREQKEAELTAAQARLAVQEERREKMLIELGQKSAIATLETQRREELQAKTRLLSDTLAQVSAKAQELQSLERATEELQASIVLQEGAPEQVQAKITQIKFIIEQNNKKIEQLKKEKAELERLQALTQQQVEALTLRIKENDHYEIILEKIYNRDVLDPDLAFDMLSICRVLKTTLDELSVGRPKRLIEALISVTLPRDPRPSRMPNSIPEGHILLGDIESRFRHIGNDFTPRGLSWSGPPLNLKECKHLGSAFERYQKDVEARAKEKITSLSSSSARGFQ